MTQATLDFDRPAARYPARAGYYRHAPETSREAAGSVDAQNLRDRVFRALVEVGNMTADECADHLGQSILSVRPRFTELSRRGVIADTGERRANRSGRMAVVWEAI